MANLCAACAAIFQWRDRRLISQLRRKSIEILDTYLRNGLEKGIPQAVAQHIQDVFPDVESLRSRIACLVREDARCRRELAATTAESPSDSKMTWESWNLITYRVPFEPRSRKYYVESSATCRLCALISLLVSKLEQDLKPESITEVEVAMLIDTFTLKARALQLRMEDSIEIRDEWTQVMLSPCESEWMVLKKGGGLFTLIAGVSRTSQSTNGPATCQLCF